MKKYNPPLKIEKDSSIISSSKRPLLKASFLESPSEKDYYYFEFLHSFKDLKEIIEKTFVTLTEIVSPSHKEDLVNTKRAISERLTSHRNALYRHAHYFKKMQRKFTGEQD